MKAIVVTFVRISDVKLPIEQPLAVPISVNLQAVVILDAHKTNPADKSKSCKESAPPFWTWFIENPRPQSSKSFLSLADLIFAP
jgi:hypothetical protein